MTKLLTRQTRGVIPIVPTPFEADGAIRFADVPQLVDYYRGCGVLGLTILGVMGEAAKLTPAETLDVVRSFTAAAGDRLPVIVGVSANSLAAPVDLAQRAMDLGAAGVMLQPMGGLAGDAVADYFARFVEQTAGRVPVCAQDYPQASGVTLTVPAWERISQLDPVIMLKHEPPAGLQKLSQIRAAEADGRARRVSILTSNNAMHLPQELDRGADGAMVGVALSDVICRTVAEFHAGNRDRAFDLYDAALPLIRHETQGAFGLAVRKEVLRRRGALTSAALRYPGMALGQADLQEIDRLLERFRLRAAALDYDWSP